MYSEDTKTQPQKIRRNILKQNQQRENGGGAGGRQDSVALCQTCSPSLLPATYTWSSNTGRAAQLWPCPAEGAAAPPEPRRRDRSERHSGTRVYWWSQLRSRKDKPWYSFCQLYPCQHSELYFLEATSYHKPILFSATLQFYETII